jgi:hypothetical protein
MDDSYFIKDFASFLLNRNVEDGLWDLISSFLDEKDLINLFKLIKPDNVRFIDLTKIADGYVLVGKTKIKTKICIEEGRVNLISEKDNEDSFQSFIQNTETLISEVQEISMLGDVTNKDGAESSLNN